MRVLFATSLIAALVNAGGAPSAKSNNAKRNWGDEAPARFNKEKILIATDQKETNDGKGNLSLQVVLKAEDMDRTKNQMLTVLKLEVDGVSEGNKIDMGWAMKLTAAKDIPVVVDGKEKLDGQGTTRDYLIARANAYQGAIVWEGINLSRTYNGGELAENGDWLIGETIADAMPDVVGAGLPQTATALHYIVDQDESKIQCTAGNCSAEVTVQRVFDMSESGAGYEIEVLNEKAFDFIGWYMVDCSAPAAEGGDSARRLNTCTPKKGQSEKAQVYILGAMSGLAAVSAAILSTMLF